MGFVDCEYADLLVVLWGISVWGLELEVFLLLLDVHNNEI